MLAPQLLRSPNRRRPLPAKRTTKARPSTHTRPRRRAVPPDGAAQDKDRNNDTGVGRIEALVAELRTSLAEVPRAEDFLPLADHLYGFAQSAPKLLEGLASAQEAVAPIESAGRAMRELAETFQLTQQSFNESLMRLPRAEDYEPLAAPLREFARVSPALTQALADAMRATAPLGNLVGELRETTAALRSLSAAAAHRPPKHDAAAREGAQAPKGASRDAVQAMSRAAAAIRSALQTLPRDREYAKVAAQLREIASVSPSLGEWLREVPRLSMPLGASIETLEAAANELDAAREKFARALEKA